MKMADAVVAAKMPLVKAPAMQVMKTVAAHPRDDIGADSSIGRLALPD
jgi:hypothetical protein